MASVRRLVSEEAFQDMDYLLPTVSKDFAGLIPRPSTPGLVKPLSWHSFRVFIPDCAFQMGIAACTWAIGSRRARQMSTCCGDLGPGSAEGPQPEPRARQGTQGGLESPGLGGPQWTSRTQVRRAARTKLKGKGKHPLQYPQGAHHRLDHGQWWNTNLGTHQ